MFQFKYGEHTLANIDTYTYLELDFTANGSTKPAVQARIAKANGAIFTLKQTITTTGNVDVKLALDMYDKQIQPILT